MIGDSPSFVQVRVVRSILVASILVLAASLFGSAQTATILGSVTDPSGAAVPNAQINLTDLDTNQVTHFITNNVGQYVAPDLPIGRYTAQVNASGFQTVGQQNIVLVSEIGGGLIFNCRWVVRNRLSPSRRPLPRFNRSQASRVTSSTRNR